jgi:hypothetical protein
MDTLELQYEQLIRGKSHAILQAYQGSNLNKAQEAFLGLVHAVQKNQKNSEALLGSITQRDLDGFNEQQKAIYFEGMVLNLVAEKRSSEAIATLCRNALLHWEKAYFARKQLAILEMREHPQKGIEQFENQLKYYPDDPDSLMAISRILLGLHKKQEALEFSSRSPDRFRRGLYKIILEMFSNWVMYTLTFVLLILLVYTPVVSLIFFILASAFCVAMMIYAMIKKDPLIFNYFFSIVLIITVLIVVKWLFLK